VGKWGNMKRLLSGALVGSLLGLAGIGSAVALAAPAGAKALGCGSGPVADTDAVVSSINKTIAKENKKVQKAIDKANLAPGDSKTHDTTLSTGVIVRTTLSRSADGNTYSFEGDFAQPSSAPTFVEVTSGDRTKTVSGSIKTIDEHVSTSYDLLRTFIPLKLSGSFSADVNVVKDPSQAGQGVRNTISVNFTNIMVKNNDPHGPRTGTYTHVGEPGVGGDLDYHASIPTPCTSNPNAGAAEVTTHHRHFVSGTTVTARRDTLITGGTLGAGEKVVELGCGTTTVNNADLDPSRYHLRKHEDASGATVSGAIKTKNPSDPPCSAAFGLPVPQLGNNSTDYDFSTAVTFPGEW